MNEYDSSRMADLLKESHELKSTNVAEEADVLLLNTSVQIQRKSSGKFSISSEDGEC